MKRSMIYFTAAIMALGLFVGNEAMAGRKIKVRTATKTKVTVSKKKTFVHKEVKRLPAKAKKIVVKSKSYFYHDGVFYEPSRAGYRTIKAPIGVRIKVLPHGFTTVVVRGLTYYICYDTYYRFDRHADEYYVVEEPEPVLIVQDDILTMTDGEIIQGAFIGGNEETIEFQIEDDIYEIALDEIVSIIFNPPTR